MSKENEKAFFDAEYSTGARRRVGQFYSLIHGRLESYEDHIYRDIQNRRVLEYGCGTGSYSLELLKRGADLVGIDISEIGIEKARQKANTSGYDRSEFLVMDVENMNLPNQSFDLVCGVGILHHLCLDRALSELSRVMRRDGVAVFMEPLGHNILINLFRRATPRMRTDDEHPLVKSDIIAMKEYFANVHVEFYHISSLLAMLLIKTRWFFPVVRKLDRFDQWLVKKVSFIKWAAWYCIIVLRSPTHLAR